MIGSTVGRYDVLEKVGEGGMATVYRGRHNTLDRDVAIKVLHPHMSSSARNRERFAREARAIEHLTHDNILEIYDYSGPDAAECWIVTEYVSGETLTEILARCRRIPSEVAASIGLSLASALSFAHRAGVLHRDLKPDNVMVREDGTVKLMDFGIARFLDESQVTMTGALVGSPAFMSPEQAREDTLDGRSDLFSLGTLLFLLVTGELPFQGSNPSIILKHIIEGSRDAVSNLAPEASAAFGDVVERLMSPTPDDRYPDAAAVVLALQATVDEVGFDPWEPRWSLARYRTEPDQYEQELDAFLRMRLMRSAREAIGRGEPLTGLRLLNRLLELEPDHEEAMALLQDLHGGALAPDRNDGNRRAAWVILAVLLLLLPVAWWAFRSPADVDVDAIPGAPPVAADRDAASPGSAFSLPQDPARAPPDSDRSMDSDRDAEVDPAHSAEDPSPSARPPTRTVVRSQDVLRRPRPRRIEVRAVQPTPRAISRARAEAAAPETDAIDAASDGLPADEPACLAIRTDDAFAEIFLDDVRIGNTREKGCRPVPAGTHRFLLRHRGIVDETVEITLEPGEQRTEVVPLERRPARVRFTEEHSDDCIAVLDAAPLGTLAALGREVQVDDPASPHTLDLRCGRQTLRREWTDGIRFPQLTFDGRAVP